MQQYFVDQIGELGTLITLDEEQSHHIAHVVRMKEDEQIRIVEGRGHVYLAKVHFEDHLVKALLIEKLIDRSKPCVEITLAQGLIKKEKWDFLLQKSAELGVSCIQPFISSRTVVKAKEERAEKKRARYEKILLEACEQCKRSTLVQLKDTLSFSALSELQADLKLIAYEDADHQADSLLPILKQHQNVQTILAVVGSEGGFSKQEVEQLLAQGYLCVSLGPRILRAETAAMSFISNLNFYYENQEGDRG